MERTAERIALMLQGIVSGEGAERLIGFAMLNIQDGSALLRELGVEKLEELTEEQVELLSKRIAQRFAEVNDDKK